MCIVFSVKIFIFIDTRGSLQSCLLFCRMIRKLYLNIKVILIYKKVYKYLYYRMEQLLLLRLIFTLWDWRSWHWLNTAFKYMILCNSWFIFGKYTDASWSLHTFRNEVNKIYFLIPRPRKKSIILIGYIICSLSRAREKISSLKIITL